MSDHSVGPVSKQGIGILGGSFDPVHLGHLWMAEAALGQLPIDHVRWIPAATSPLKLRGPVASNAQRLQMLQLALSGRQGHQIDTWELDRDEISYTIDTLKHLRSTHPDQPLYLVIGADSLASFGRWKDPVGILEICTLAVIARGGWESPDYDLIRPYGPTDEIAHCRENEIKMPQIEISSSGLRDRVGSHQSIRFQVPHPVEVFIRNENLYCPPNS